MKRKTYGRDAGLSFRMLLTSGLLGLLLGAGRRKELLRTGAEAIGTLLAMGIILDVVFQLIIYHSVHPGAAVMIGPILICFPYALSRALTASVARKIGEI
jgi:hypothetical protein